MRHPDLGPAPDLWAGVAPLAAAAGIGALGAILGAVRQINPDLVLRFEARSWVGGLAGAVAGWALGRGLWHLGRGRGQGRMRLRVVGGLGTLGVVTVVGFVAAAAGLPASRRGDTAIGALLALGVLSVVGWVLWRLARLFGDPGDGDPDGG